ncbi:MAG: glucosaminidase domain-containing protein, partial [Bacteroidota bacterium]
EQVVEIRYQLATFRTQLHSYVNQLVAYLNYLLRQLQLHKWTLCSMLFLFYLLHAKNIDIQLSLNEPAGPLQIVKHKQVKDPIPSTETPMPVVSGVAFHESEQVTKKKKSKPAQEAYIRRFAKVAQQEMKKFGIPASIKLAQGLLESNAGKSPLATKNNNHFGIKCFSRKCQKGHCSNFDDDSHKDFFRVYQNSWESYRAHSRFLTKGARYQSLFRLSPNDHRAWATGLQRAGYATDPQYATKLLELIERYDLTIYDRM